MAALMAAGEVVMAKTVKNGAGGKKHAGGRPSKYKAEFATKEHVQGFIDHCKAEKEIVTLCGYAVYIDVSEDTIAEWARVHLEFTGTVAKVKRISKQQLFQGGLDKSLSSRIVKLGLSANHGMNETSNQHVTGGLDQRIILGRRKK